MKKIIHFSDIHIGYEGMYERFRFVIHSLITQKQPATNYVIVITGDLVDAASMVNYTMAKECLDMLTSEGYQVLVVPGNHDYGTGNAAEKKWVEEFKKHFFGAQNTNLIYPKLDIIDGIAFIGLDSMEDELGTFDRFMANGELGKKQRERLDKMLGSVKVKKCRKTVVYLHHHPLDPIPMHELKDTKELEKILTKYVKKTGQKRGIDAVLYGHLHFGKKSNGWCGIQRVYDAGSTTMKEGAPGYHRVIDLNKEQIWDYDADLHGGYAREAQFPLPKTLLQLCLGRS